MRTNKFLLGILTAGAMFASCSNELPGNEQPENGEKGEKSFMTVSIKPTSITRTASSDGYVDGEGDENTVNSVDFYFFKKDGDAFILGNGTVEEGDQVPEGKIRKNLYTLKKEAIDDDSEDYIDEIVQATLVIEHHTGDVPASIVAVLNTNGEYAGMTLEDLQKEILDSHTLNGFVMSNSAYVGADGETAIAQPITAANLASSADVAEKNPVSIYVERLAARVNVINKMTPETNGGHLAKRITISGEGEVDVYAKIIGWDLNTTADDTYVIKKIDKTWDFSPTWTWNNPAHFRSYWAKNVDGLTTTKNFKWESLTNTLTAKTVDYCLENTTAPQKAVTNGVYDRVASRINNTKALIAAELIDFTGNKVQIANWYGQNYRLANFKQVIADVYKTKLLKSTDGGVTCTPIEVGDIELRQGTGLVGDKEESYKVYFEFSNTGKAATWYYLDEVTNTYKAYSTTGTGTAADVLYSTEPARIWNGMAYYIVNIQHLGAKTTDDGIDAEKYQTGYYGVVRNHAYNLELNSIKGLGTPVYDKTSDIPWPVDPDLTESFIAADIKVLAWHIIKMGVDLD